MSTKTTTQEKATDATTTRRRSAEAVRKRVHRALDSFFHVEANGENGKYTVFSGSGNAYTVTLPAGTCTCPDGQRGPWCKHAHRAAFVTGELPDIDGVRAVRGEPDAEGDERDDLTTRVERFAAKNPDASVIEIVAQLGIDPTERERIEEILT